MIELDLQEIQDRELLGIDEDAGEAEIVTAYKQRRMLYEGDNLATYNLLNDEERQIQLAELDAARTRLIDAIHASEVTATHETPSVETAQQPASDTQEQIKPPEGPEPDRNEMPGAYLRYRRLAAGFTLAQVAEETKILAGRIEALESEQASQLPAPVFVRGFVINIGRMLNVDDPEGLARSFVDRVLSGE